jgi:alkylation response protein AidB-like acyl-CoA dehydrogenase
VSFLAAARDLGPLVAAEAARTSEEGHLSPTVVQAFTDAELWWMLIPLAHGGGGATTTEAIEVIEEISRVDASSGWSLMAPMSSTACAAGFLPQAGFDAMFGGDRPVSAGQFAPRGTATAQDGQLLVNGQYGFASGSTAATWLAGGLIVMDGAERARIDGHADARVFFLPKDHVELQGNWDVLGLEGTGSVDYRVTDQLVPEHLTFPLIQPVPVRSGVVFGLTLYGLGAMGHGGVALGIGKRALEEITRIARTKQRLGQDGLGGQQKFLYDLGANDAALQAARAFLLRAYADAEQEISARGSLSELGYQRLRQAVTHVTGVASDVVRFAYTAGGSTALRTPNPLADCLRHVSGATQHLFVDPTSLVDAAKVLLHG